ncbi:MAG: nucleoside kinase [Firmicutes bacterium]|nr:nucleoside kinase [Bacillota bacterium]
MINAINITVNGKEYEISSGMTLEEISKDYEKDFKYPILAAKVNNRLRELTTEVTEDANIEFLDLTTKTGNRIHVSGLIYILIYSIKKLYGEAADIKVEHSIDKGIFIKTNFRLTEAKLKNIKDTMKSVVDADMPITNVTVDRIEAINYFKSVNNESKAGVMRYNTNDYVNLYRLGNLYDYFYTLMPISTSKLKNFDLTYISDDGLVLRFPTIYVNSKIPEYKHHPAMFDVFKECRDWANTIKINNATDLNNILAIGHINHLIRVDETLQSNKLLNVAREISGKRDKIKIVLMAGPSSSGKTTTSKKLCTYLASFGLIPRVLSMDDYFLDRKDTPVDEDGNPDYESLDAMDMKLFDSQIADLLKGNEIKNPTYNFPLGKKEYKTTMKMDDSDILVIEGIHALDTKILTNISRDKKYKIYISALTELNMDDHNRISTTDNRLLRRIIRDNRTRNYKVEHTLEAWPSVRDGEEKYIFPFQDEADFVFNSALIYELGVLKTYVEPLLYSVPNDSPYYEDAKRLLNFLRLFLPIPADAIPQDSILREFIGGSCFHD